LARFIEYDDIDVSAILSHLHSVIIPPLMNNDAPQIYHPSFPDFLTDPERCSDPRFVISVGAHERRLSLQCFVVMKMYLKRNLTGIRDPSLLNCEVKDFEQEVDNTVPFELRYACRYWAAHLSCVEHGDEAVVQALRDFSMGSLLWWFEAMSLIGSAFTAAGSIQEAHRWAVCASLICHGI
jgi:hypothetical protein